MLRDLAMRWVNHGICLRKSSSSEKWEDSSGLFSASQEHGVCGDGGMELRATREQGLQIFLFYEIITNISGHNLI